MGEALTPPQFNLIISMLQELIILGKRKWAPSIIEAKKFVSNYSCDCVTILFACCRIWEKGPLYVKHDFFGVFQTVIGTMGALGAD